MTSPLLTPFNLSKWLKSALLLFLLCFQSMPAAQVPEIMEENQQQQRKIQEEVDHWLLKAYSGDAEAQYRVALMFAGGLGVKTNPKEAVNWYWKSAAQGFAPAQFNLGDAYLRGIGVEQNYEQAVKFWHLAARSGLVPAQTNLGRAYYLGVGVERDLEQAEIWLMKAARSGDEVAGRLLAKIDSEPDQAPNILRDSDSVWVYGRYIATEGSSSKVVGTGVRARSQPTTSNNSVVVGKLRDGQQVTVLNRKGDWLLVRVASPQSPAAAATAAKISADALLSENTRTQMPVRVGEGYQQEDETSAPLLSSHSDTASYDPVVDSPPSLQSNEDSKSRSSRDPFELAPGLVEPLQTRVAADLELPPLLSQGSSGVDYSNRDLTPASKTAISELDLPPTLPQPTPLMGSDDESSAITDETEFLTKESSSDKIEMVEMVEPSLGVLPAQVENPVPVEAFPELALTLTIEPDIQPVLNLSTDTNLNTQSIAQSAISPDPVDTSTESLPPTDKEPGKLATGLATIKRTLATLFRRKPKEDKSQPIEVTEDSIAMLSTDSTESNSPTDPAPLTRIAGQQNDDVTEKPREIEPTGIEAVQIPAKESSEQVAVESSQYSETAMVEQTMSTSPGDRVIDSTDERLDMVTEDPVGFESARVEALEISTEIAVLFPSGDAKEHLETEMSAGTRHTISVESESDIANKINNLPIEQDVETEVVDASARETEIENSDEWPAIGSDGVMETAMMQDVESTLSEQPALVADQSTGMTESAVKTDSADKETPRIDGYNRANQWLYSQPANHFTIQFVSLETEDEALDFIDINSLDEARYFFSRKNGKDWYYVVSGSYPTRTEAAAAARAYADLIKSTWVRNLGALQTTRCGAIAELSANLADEISKLCNTEEPSMTTTDEPAAFVSETQPEADILEVQPGPLVDDNEWLFSRTESDYTIQLLSTTSEAAAHSFVEKHELKLVKMFRTVISDKEWYYLLSGDYSTRGEAKDASKNLPVQSVMLRKFGILQDARCRALSALPPNAANAVTPYCSG